MIMACKYKSRVLDNGWCKVACMYCTFTQEKNCEHKAYRIKEGGR